MSKQIITRVRVFINNAISINVDPVAGSLVLKNGKSHDNYEKITDLNQLFQFLLVKNTLP
jgi:hypothetical protein